LRNTPSGYARLVGVVRPRLGRLRDRPRARSGKGTLRGPARWLNEGRVSRAAYTEMRIPASTTSTSSSFPVVAPSVAQPAEERLGGAPRSLRLVGIPSVTKVKVVPPSISRGSRGWWVSTKTGVWKGGLSPHQPFQGGSSLLAPRAGPAPEHVPAHHGRADVRLRLLDHGRAGVDLATLMPPTPSGFSSRRAVPVHRGRPVGQVRGEARRGRRDDPVRLLGREHMRAVQRVVVV